MICRRLEVEWRCTGGCIEPDSSRGRGCFPSIIQARLDLFLANPRQYKRVFDVQVDVRLNRGEVQAAFSLFRDEVRWT